MSEKPIQDYWEHNHCWGCGAANDHGLKIKSILTDEDSVCSWTPSEHHKAGPDNVLYGGIIASIIDCHSVCTAIAEAYRREGRALDTPPPIWYVTASLTINYRKPTPIDKPVTLRANVIKNEGRKSIIICELLSEGLKRVEAEILAVRVPPENWT